MDMHKLVLAALFLLPALASAQSVDLLYQGASSLPPFYQGGALWPTEGSLVFYAIPQGLGNPANLSYKWIKDGTVLGSVSGVGQSSLASNDPLFSKSQRIEVQIVNAEDEILARSAVTVAPVLPGALVYEEHPLFGFLFNREVSGTYSLPGGEATFATFPLYFSAQGRSDARLSYSWRSQGRQDSGASTVTYRVPEGAEGRASATVKITNPSSVRQFAEKAFSLTFGDTQ